MARLGRSVPTTARRVDLEHIAGQHLCLADVAQVFYAAITAHHPVDADLPTLAPGHAESPVDTAVGQNAGRHGNPYSPLSTDPHLPMKASVRDSFIPVRAQGTDLVVVQSALRNCRTAQQDDIGLLDPTRPDKSPWVDAISGASVRNGLPATMKRA